MAKGERRKRKENQLWQAVTKNSLCARVTLHGAQCDRLCQVCLTNGWNIHHKVNKGEGGGRIKVYQNIPEWRSSYIWSSYQIRLDPGSFSRFLFYLFFPYSPPKRKRDMKRNFADKRTTIENFLCVWLEHDQEKNLRLPFRSSPLPKKAPHFTLISSNTAKKW